ncbi:hypothetical protein ['Fragaria x ananassa' phyllody phytoplasma]|uniref:hypothetical protein n=1 Tax='Fragaria x ananassa' phyllody phytoplasma TaxID=2358428 RepID=UPI001CEC9213|nr:hypothetical protein ['Fragaria x ananassa' phyllody phytoplasma]
MNLEQIIINIFEYKIFISLISVFFGIFVYWFYLYLKELRNKYEFSDELRDVVNYYIKNGSITVKEFGALNSISYG